jgi:hypothetical protein
VLVVPELAAGEIRVREDNGRLAGVRDGVADADDRDDDRAA